MKVIIRRLLLSLFVGVFATCAGAYGSDAFAKRGKIVGGLAHEIPEWFKDSFLDIREDAREAADENKHLILFMSLNGCPYCTKMLDEVFEGDKEYIQKHFDSVAINIKGAREVTPDASGEITEKQFASKMRVLFTPTVLFLDGDAKPIYRINGLWNAKMFHAALEFVQSKSYKTMSLPSFVKAQALKAKAPKSAYQFRDHEKLSTIDDFSKLTQPVAVLFEDKDCMSCNTWHDKLWNRTDVKLRLKKFIFTRLDANSNKPIVDFKGNKTTPSKWAKKLALTVRPTLVLFDAGVERQRVVSELYGFHFQVALGYVGGGHYKTHKTWLDYLSVEAERVLKTGENVDLGDRPAAGQ